jgi:hypothetical protein
MYNRNIFLKNFTINNESKIISIFVIIFYVIIFVKKLLNFFCVDFFLHFIILYALIFCYNFPQFVIFLETAWHTWWLKHYLPRNTWSFPQISQLSETLSTAQLLKK